eukprot:Tamp_18828.p1 GENE.Tamp_18828~~Tamp_18828.p1  ORF type:complete len:381 (+),score=36.37 Tamp_18828:40-1182(+)
MAPRCPAQNGVTCNGFGHCDAEAKCACLAGYGGLSCDMKCTTDALLRPCSGHGQCGATSGRCECEEGYAGPACAQKCPRFEGVVCSGRGSCSSDGRQARCVCAAGDGAMIAAYLGEACEISVFNTMARLGNQTVHSDVDGRPGLMVLPPVLIALLFIALVLYFFRANWAREYLDGGKHMLCQIRNLHLPHDLHLVDMLHAHHGEEDAELSYVLAADASKEEVESRIADVFDSVLKEAIAKVADELDDEEEDIRAVYKDHRPPGLTKNEWKSKCGRQIFQVHLKCRTHRRHCIRLGLERLGLRVDLPAASLSRVNRQVSQLSLYKEGTKGERMYQHLTVEEFRLWAMEAWYLCQRTTGGYGIRDWRIIAQHANVLDLSRSK